MTLTRLLATVTAWHVASQHRARRNALVASTALAQQRRERDEIEEFLAAHVAHAERSTVVSVTVPTQRAASRTA
jgi:hypothetical protein